MNMPDVSDYDKVEYDYSTYWEKRSYENRAEKRILNKIFRDKVGKWFLDVGGSYGRITSTYYNSYNNPIILDYSLKTLQKNQETIKAKYPKSVLIAANAYKMPFKQNCFDGGVMVRVLHHIEKPATYFKEIERVLSNNSTYVQEYANKKHIKAAIRAIFKLNLDIFSTEPYEQPRANNGEGSNIKERSIFYNYHPKYIKNLLKTYNFTLVKKYGCSYLRSPLIKKIINDNIMMFFESIMQELLSWSNISPSIFLETKLIKEQTGNVKNERLEDILVCPSCKEDLLFEGNKTARCRRCPANFLKEEGIWDFRVK